MHVFSARAQTIESALHVARSALRLPFSTDNAYNRAHNRGLSALRPDGGSGGSQTGRGASNTRSNGMGRTGPMETEMRPSFASLLKEHRRACGLSQEKLAEAAGLSREAIGLLERGARRSPRRDTVTLLTRTLNLSDNERARLLAAAAMPRSARLNNLNSSSSLPPRLTSFIGRQGEIAEVGELVLAKRLVTLSGPGGIGKTSLALAVAFTVQPQIRDGAWFVELAA